MDNSKKVYGTFHIDQSEFTLAVDCIQEVVNYPDRVIGVPLAPDYLIGIFNLRGSIIPVIDMRKLMEFPEAKKPSSGKIAIVDLGVSKVGLLFDSTGEILHIQESQRSEFETSGHHAVKGAIKLDDGNRIVQILDPAALLRMENLPVILEKVAGKNTRADREAHARGPRLQCIAFMAGTTKLAIEISAIHEIIKVPELQASVVDDVHCLGMGNLRGTVLPVVDFVKMLGFRESSERQASTERVIVMKVGKAKVGLLIDSVDNIVSYYRDEILPIPMLGNARSEMFDGMISREGLSDMILLNASGVLSSAGIKSIAEEYDKLFGEKGGKDEKTARSAGRRHSCIAFQLERSFAFPIHEIREIINYSDETVRPPGLPEQIRGVLNLRGQAITIVDLRRLYSMAPFADLTQVKVLIVERDQVKYGLLVDAVDDIVSFFDDQKLEIPTVLLHHNGDAFHGEVKEILEIAATDTHAKKCLMILSLERVFDKIEGVLKSA